jgi:hypothetical protein
MRGDFTRYTSDPRKEFTRVLQQQGRLQVDADWNEQVDIFWGYLRSLASDLIGPYGGPEHNCGFRILAAGDFPLTEKDAPSREEQDELLKMLNGEGDFLIGPGRYYVAGMPCTGSRYISYAAQAPPDELALQKKNNASFLIYLDAWEIHRTEIEEESIREVALLGMDTSTRAKLAWRVGFLELPDYGKSPTCVMVREHWHGLVENVQPIHRGLLRARAAELAEGSFSEPGTLSSEARYRGTNNQLYRVEVHQPGSLATGDVPTFKFSRENGSVIFPVHQVNGKVVTLGRLGRDARSRLQVGDWVELVDDDYELQRRAEPLLRIDQIVPGKLQITLSELPKSTVGQDRRKHPLLRRWDHKEGDPRKSGLELRQGSAILKEGERGNVWLNLENGVQVQFLKTEPANVYRTGDYWTIPARVATGNVVWPHHEGEPEAREPDGAPHYYAPLAIASFSSKGVLATDSDCRLRFKPPTHYGESLEP